jgi:hypothetical protein
MPEGIYQANPPEPYENRKGKQPTLLSNDVVKVLLSSPNTWFRIAERSKWISGVKQNIESMTQRNISHLADKGKFEIQQRKNINSNNIDIYCRFVTTNNEEE